MEYYGQQPRRGMPVAAAALLGAIVGGLLVALLTYTLWGGNGAGTAMGPAGSIPQDEVLYKATAISDTIQPAVVGIANHQRTTNFLAGTSGLVERGSGTGFIYDAQKGYIITNQHVIDGAEEITVSLHDGRNLVAKVVGSDARTDLAVLEIEDRTNLVQVKIGDSNALRVGEPVIAIGNPGGMAFARSVTQGIVSALDRYLDLQGEASFKLIQTDAAINPGNSGGPLVNFEGEVIAINAAKSGYEGMGFAIPISDAEPVIKELIEKGYASHAALMVSINDRYRLTANSGMPEGCYVASVQPDAGAGQAGIKEGDIITAINGAAVKNSLQLSHELFKYNVGDTVDVTYYRDGASHVVKVTLSELRQDS
ncbi:MAG: trypsin-like peptidase domain-containing protein [Peptococcaceae bacterium]|nr:trypsin-like peptidase domain-containing protein [Peptococcaceae bacterium]